MEFIVCKEMMEQRGYEIVSVEDAQIVATKQNGDYIYVFFKILKINNVKLQELTSIMKDTNINHIIVVYNESVTPSAKKIISDISAEMVIELFHINELQYNITKHKLQPRFERLKTHVSFKKTYGRTTQAVLLSTDPIARFYNYRKGDVIRVVRQDGYVCYRIVK